MNKPTFTKGPWHCGQGNGEGSIFADNGGRVTFSKKGTVLHPICHVANSFEQNEDEANARLIASAPAMYEVLAELLDTLEVSRGYGFDEEYENVREVLAKADGAEA